MKLSNKLYLSAAKMSGGTDRKMHFRAFRAQKMRQDAENIERSGEIWIFPRANLGVNAHGHDDNLYRSDMAESTVLLYNDRI